MKLYIFDYSSEGNIFSGEICIEAEGLVEAQDKFFAWVKKQQTQAHLSGALRPHKLIFLKTTPNFLMVLT